MLLTKKIVEKFLQNKNLKADNVHNMFFIHGKKEYLEEKLEVIKKQYPNIDAYINDCVEDNLFICITV